MRGRGEKGPDDVMTVQHHTEVCSMLLSVTGCKSAVILQALLQASNSDSAGSSVASSPRDRSRKGSRHTTQVDAPSDSLLTGQAAAGAVSSVSAVSPACSAAGTAGR